jgi:acetate kinase
MKILVLNAGSSSQKSCLYDLSDQALPDDSPQPLWAGQLDWLNNTVELQVKVGDQVVHQTWESRSRSEDTHQMLQTLWRGDQAILQHPKEIDLVGHRVVHGGAEYQQSVWIDAEVKAAIGRLAGFAPIHNPINLAGIETITTLLGEIPQVAVFDTAFHAQIPAPAYTYPIPAELSQQGIRRYGFHGISHHYCAHRAARLLSRDLQELRLIICHLGNGCSLAAIREGHSIDTTMGFTPLEGLMMGSRSGSIDPGILIYLLRQSGYTADRLDTLLNYESGLLGVSGVSNDMRKIIAAIEQGNEPAKLALAVYHHRLCAAIASLLPGLGGLDALIFTAGVGEHSPVIRSMVCQSLAFLGVNIDPEQNLANPIDQDIALANSAIRVLVIHTQEDWAIAQSSWHLWAERKGKCEG